MLGLWPGTAPVGGFEAEFDPRYDETIDGYTVAAWVRRDPGQPHAAQNNIFHFGQAGARLIWLSSVGAGGTLQIEHGTATYRGMRGTTSVTDGQWHHVVAVLDRRTSTPRVFVDGVLDSPTLQILDAATFPIPLPGDRRVSFGLHGQDGGAPWHGELRDMVLLSRPLSPLEVRHWYATGQRWGTTTVPGAQLDGDDLIVEGPGGVREFELVGARPLADRAGDLGAEVLGYWPLNAVGAATDLTGGADLVVQGEVAYGRGRFGGQSVGWDLTDGDLLLPDPDRLNAGELTLEAWVLRTAEGGNYPRVASKSSISGQNGGGYDLYLWGQGRAHAPTCQIDLGNDVVLISSADEETPMNRWVHLACVWDEVRLKTYVDGLERTSLEVIVEAGQTREWGPDQAIGPIPAGDAPFRVGFVGGGNAEANRFPGRIAEVAVHGAARSSDWIYKRAHPLPRVRFGVSTVTFDAEQDGNWEYDSYRLTWGGAEVVRREAFDAGRVDDLLSARNGVLAWWRFEESAFPGAKVIDWSTARAHGTAADAGVDAGAGIRGGASLRFDGDAGDSVIIDDRGLIPAGEGLTAEVLLNASRVDTGQTFLADAERSGIYLQWGHPDSNNPSFDCNLPNGEVFIQGEDNLVVGRDYSLACSADDGALQSFVDRTPERRIQGRGADLAVGGSDLAIGSYSNGGEAFAGRIGEVRLSGRGLADHELLGRTPTRVGRPPRRLSACEGRVGPVEEDAQARYDQGPIEIARVADLGGQPRVALAWSGHQAGVAWRDSGAGTRVVLGRVDDDGAEVGQETLVSQIVGAGSSVDVTTGLDGAFGVSWIEDSAGKKVYFAEVGGDGQVAMPRVQVTETATNKSRNATAWTGAGYALSWAEQSDGWEIHTAHVSPGGLVTGGGAVSETPASSTDPSLVWNGEELGLSWRFEGDAVGGWGIYLARLNAVGEVIQEGRRISQGTLARGQAMLAWTGHSYGMAWIDRAGGNAGIHFAQASRSAAAIDANSFVASAPHEDRSVSTAWSGADFAVAFVDTAGGSRRPFVQRVSSSGARTGPRLALAVDQGPAEPPKVVWTGRDYAVAWSEHDVGNDEYVILYARGPLSCPAAED